MELDKLKALSQGSTEQERVVAWGEALEGVHEAVRVMRKAPRPATDSDYFGTALVMVEASLNEMVWCLTGGVRK